MDLVSIIFTIIATALAVPGSIIAFNQLRGKTVVMKKEEFLAGQKDKVISEHTKPFLRLFDRYFIKKLPMKSAEKDARILAERMRKDNYVPTIIVGIGRGGAVFGSFLSYNLSQVPIFVMDRAYSWQKKREDSVMFDFDIPPRFMDKVLLVSGEIHSGNTMNTFEAYLREMGAKEIRVSSFYLQNTSTYVPQYNRTKGSGIPLMPWQDRDYKRDSISADLSKELNEERRLFTADVNKTIYPLRHSETTQNAKDTFIGAGTERTPLTKNGQNQAETAGQIIRADLGNTSAIVHCSPQQRCQATVNAMNKSLNAVVVTSPALRERNFGDWEGVPRGDLKKKEEYIFYVDDPIKFCPPHAETMLNTISRAIGFLQDEIIKDAKSNNHIIVTHKTTGRILLSYLMNTPYSKDRNIKLENDSIVKITIKGNTIKCHYLR